MAITSDVLLRNQVIPKQAVVTDNSLTGSGTLADPLKVADVVYATQYDDVGGGVAYLGEAIPGTLTSAASWRIKKIITTGADIEVLWADGDASFNNIYDNHVSLTYE